MASRNSSRDALNRHKSRMCAAGFRRLNVWCHPDLVAALAQQRKPKECTGRTIERLILGEARKRPAFKKVGRKPLPRR